MIERGPGRPQKGYFTSHGQRVPSVTTITNRFKDSGALMTWAWKQGRDGFELYETRDKKAAIGTVVHKMAELHIHGEDPLVAILQMGPTEVHEGSLRIEPAFARSCERAFSAYKRWARGRDMAPLATEVPLVSDRHSFGGTADLWLNLGDNLVEVADFKTGGGPYVEHKLQLAGYGILGRECRGWEVDGWHVLRFSDNGSLGYKWWPRDEEAEEQFLDLRRCYARDKTLRKSL